jgi:hypothetical protein
VTTQNRPLLYTTYCSGTTVSLYAQRVLTVSAAKLTLVTPTVLRLTARARVHSHRLRAVALAPPKRGPAPSRKAAASANRRLSVRRQRWGNSHVDSVMRTQQRRRHTEVQTVPFYCRLHVAGCNMLQHVASGPWRVVACGPVLFSRRTALGPMPSIVSPTPIIVRASRCAAYGSRIATPASPANVIVPVRRV